MWDGECGEWDWNMLKCVEMGNIEVVKKYI